MTLVIVKIITLKQYGVIWNKITVVVVVVKKETCRFIRRVKRSDIFKDSRSNLEI